MYRIGLLFTLGMLLSKQFLLRNSTAPLLKVERSVSDRFLKRSKSSLNTFIGAEIATEPRFGKYSFQVKRGRCKLYDGQGPPCSHWERFGTISAPQQNINSCSHSAGAKTYPVQCEHSLSILLVTFNYRARGTCGPSTLNYSLNGAAN